MTTTKTSRVLDAIDEMTERDLSKVRAHLVLRGGTGEGATNKTREASVYVHDAVVRVLQSYGVLDTPPLAVVRRQPLYAKLQSGAEGLLKLIDQHVKPEGRVGRLKATRMLLCMLVRRLQRDSVPVSYKTLVQSLSRVGAVVDQQFPGYIQSGLLSSIVRV